jgi:AcrR family transcriptional regulator
MPKLGMGPIRREQICNAAASVISREGFAHTTMRHVAKQAGVSTGMINHYFQNREDMLCQALVFVSERMQDRQRNAIAGVSKADRLKVFLENVLPYGEEQIETWRVWINSYGEAVHSPKLREVIDGRLSLWYENLAQVLDGLGPDQGNKSFPASWRLDALLNGLVIQVLVANTSLDLDQVRDEILRMAYLDRAWAPQSP